MKRLLFVAFISMSFLGLDAQEFFGIRGASGDSLFFMIPRVANVQNVSFIGCKKTAVLKIPEEVNYKGKTYIVSTIGYQALTGNREITEIIIPASIHAIETSAFEGCINLKKITIADGVAEIGDYAFQDCTNLRECTLPQSVKKIGEAIFRGCDHIKTVKLQSQLTEIPYKMFMGCFKLQSLILPSTIKTIGDYAFCNCSSLRILNIPTDATIGYKALQGCGAAAQYK